MWLRDWGATAVASLAALVAGWAARQTWLYYPKPLLVVEHNRISDITWEVTVANRGNNVALDVRLNNELIPERRTDVLDIGKSVNVAMVRVEKQDSYDSQGNPVQNLLRTDFSAQRLVITWRQGPTVAKVRAKTVRPGPRAEGT